MRDAGGTLTGWSSIVNVSDASAANGTGSAALLSYNGSTYDRVRSATTVSGTTGTGLLGVGTLGFDGTNYQRLKTDSAGILNVTSAAPVSTNAYTPYKLISAATTNATNIKASAGVIGSIQLVGNSATLYYVKLYDKASAPTVGTDVPVKTLIVPANSTNGAGSNVVLPPQGIKFTNGISFAITAGVADSDTTACASNAVIVNIDYV